MGRGPGSGRGPFGQPLGQPGEKSLNFGASSRRLLKRMAPERRMVVLLVALGVISVALSVIGPKLLGHATDLIFAGVVGKQLPAGISKDQAIAEARARGNGRFADLLSGTDAVPGSGIDFAALGRVLLLVLLLYVTASIFMWAQGYLSPGSSSAPCTDCGPTWKPSSIGCLCHISTSSPAARS